MPTESCLEESPDGFLRGLEEFNQGQYFESHKTLEELWIAEPRDVRRLYQGILQIGVAFHHLRAGRYQPVVSLLQRGTGYLRPFAPHCMGVDIEQLLIAAGRCLCEAKDLGPEGLKDFDWALVPQIEIGHSHRSARIVI
jgi:predicted metal-dependent hydrolase